MAGSLETELKLTLVNADSWRGLLEWPGWSEMQDTSAWQQENLEAQYFDTPQYSLRQARLAYRIRRENGSWVAAVKGGGSSDGGLHRRSEWEVSVEEPIPSTAYFQETSIGNALSDAVGDEPLAPLFTTNFERHTLLVRFDERTVIEVALDRGAILAAGTQEPIQEIELELKEGNIAGLLTLGARLAESFPLLFEERSKYYRGLLAAGLEGKPAKRREQTISPGLPANEGAKALILGSLHTALREYVKSRDQLQDIERLHQVRITIRRLRANLSFIKPLVHIEEYRWFQAALRELGQILGPIRELDVLAAYWKDIRESGTGLADGHSWLEEVLAAEREQQAAQIQGPFEQAHITALLLHLWSWLEGDAWQEQPQPVTFRGFCTARAGAWYRDLLDFGKKPGFDEVDTLHQLRIAGKKLRYVLENLDGVLESPPDELIDRLRQMQDGLGYLRDARQTATVLNKLLAGKSSRALQREAGILMGWQVRGALDKQRGAQKTWRRVRRRLLKYTKGHV